MSRGTAVRAFQCGYEPPYNPPIADRPLHLDLKKDRGLTVQWADGSTSYFSIPYLRKMSPSADARQLREEMARNPLTVLPASVANRVGPLVATDAEFVGNYAIRIRFSDGHDTGIYSWKYLREIDQGAEKKQSPRRHGGTEGGTEEERE